GRRLVRRALVGRPLVCAFVCAFVRPLARPIAGGFLRFLRLLAGFRGIIGDVPALALEDERRREQQALDVAAADLAGGQRRLGDPLADFKHPLTFFALVFVCRHAMKGIWEVLRCQRSARLASSWRWAACWPPARRAASPRCSACRRRTPTSGRS